MTQTQKIKSTPTAGPWRVARDPDAFCTDIVSDKGNSSHYYVAKMYQGIRTIPAGEVYDDYADDTKANAHLLAAAPALLEALKGAIGILGRSELPQAEERLETALAAIALTEVPDGE